MRFTTTVAVVLISQGMALGQKLKDPVVPVRPAPVASRHSTVAPPPVTNSSASSAAELTRLEQQAARVRLNQPAAHHPPSNTANPAATPALDLGKNKPIRVTASPQPANPPR